MVAVRALRQRASWSTMRSISSSFAAERGPSSSPSAARRASICDASSVQELLVEMLPAIRKARETGLSVRRDALHLDASVT